MAQPTVLIVVDEPAFIRLVERYATQSAYRVVRTALSEEALPLAQRERPAVILLDAALPGSGGQQVLQGLRGNAVTRDIPVVVCSGWKGTRGWESEADVHLERPVHYEDFLAALEAAGIGQRR
jgi:DNA-binding response OmpR family regulator